MGLRIFEYLDVENFLLMLFGLLIPAVSVLSLAVVLIVSIYALCSMRCLSILPICRKLTQTLLIFTIFGS